LGGRGDVEFARDADGRRVGIVVDRRADELGAWSVDA
jgi:hypothetical protein